MAADARRRAEAAIALWLSDPDWEQIGSWGSQSGETLIRHVTDAVTQAVREAESRLAQVGEAPTSRVTYDDGLDDPRPPEMLIKALLADYGLHPNATDLVGMVRWALDWNRTAVAQAVKERDEEIARDNQEIARLRAALETIERLQSVGTFHGGHSLMDADARRRAVENWYHTSEPLRTLILLVEQCVADAIAQAVRERDGQWADYVDWLNDQTAIVEEGKRRRAALGYVPKGEGHV